MTLERSELRTNSVCESDSGTAGIVSCSPAWNDTGGRGPADSAEEGDGPLTFEPRPARWRKRITVLLYCARLRMLCSANTMRISLPFTWLSLSHRDLWPSTVLVQYVWL